MTNIWLNPQAKYVRAEVDGEQWVISQESVEKLVHQNRKINVLQTGEQQRVAVARAIVNHAPLLLADEPTASLEGSQGLALIGLVRDRVRAEGSSAVIASHDTRLINLAERVFHLRDGALIASARCVWPTAASVAVPS